MMIIMFFLFLFIAALGSCGKGENDMREDKIREDKEKPSEEKREIKTKYDAKTIRDVAVNLVDSKIEIPEGITSGIINFHVKNSGTLEYSFQVEGLDIHEELDNLKPGENGTLTVELAPGVYKIYCLHDDNEAQGMSVTLGVQ
jgi:uncharacterized cupredoxin-like copper-binding protein